MLREDHFFASEGDLKETQACGKGRVCSVTRPFASSLYLLLIERHWEIVKMQHEAMMMMMLIDDRAVQGSYRRRAHSK